MQKHKIDYKEYVGYMDHKYYSIIDPPWDFNDKPPKVDGQVSYSRWNDNHECMKWVFENIKSDILFIWIPVSLEDVPHKAVCNKFKYRTRLTWRKLTKHGKEHYGLGHWFRNSTESLMVFAKDVKAIKSPLRNIFSASASDERTEKPKEAEVEIIRSLGIAATGAYLFSGPNVESFNEFKLDCVDSCL